jgi:hypothetical protein
VTTWTADDLDKIGAADELEIAARTRPTGPSPFERLFRKVLSKV